MTYRGMSQLTTEPKKWMKTSPSERKNSSQRNDPSVVEKYEGLEEEPGYVDVASRIDELELLPVKRKAGE